jgi:hypothetical protein
VATIPRAPRTARAIDLTVGERSDGPVFLASNGRRLDRHGAARIVRRVARCAGIAQPVGPHNAAARVHITAALDAGVPLRDVQEAASHADLVKVTCGQASRSTGERAAIIPRIQRLLTRNVLSAARSWAENGRDWLNAAGSLVMSSLRK